MANARECVCVGVCAVCLCVRFICIRVRVLNQAVIGSSPAIPTVVYIIETNTNKVQKLSDYGALRLPQNERGSSLPLASVPCSFSYLFPPDFPAFPHIQCQRQLLEG